MENVSLYSEARNEYLKQMATWVVPPLVEFFRKEYDEIAGREGKRAMSAFQVWCSEVPRWNQDIIERNVNSLLDSCRCDYVEDLMTAVFIAHTKMLTAIRVNSRQKKLQITLPKLDHFLHRVFVECARAFWKAPFLFGEDGTPIEKQKNILQAEAMCVEALGSAVRSLLPIKSILRDNLIENDVGEDSDEEEEPVRKSSKKVKHTAKAVATAAPEPVKEESSDSEEEDDGDSTDSEDEIATDAVVVPKVPVAQIVPQKGGDEIPLADEIPIDDIIPPAPVAAPAPAPAPAPVVAAAPAPAPAPVVAAAPAPVDIQTTVGVQESKPEVKAVVATQEPPVVSVSRETMDSVPVPKVPALPTPAPKLTLIKEDAPAAAAAAAAVAPVQDVVIDTEPSVRFSSYEMVFDENKATGAEMRYAPKMSIEEMPDRYDDDDSDWYDGGGGGPLPRISISGAESSDIDAEVIGGGSSANAGPKEEALGLSDADFETL